MSKLQRTVFFDQHVALGAKIVEFAGWEMPIFYPTGIVQEHLATRKRAGLFDVSHMGRFIFRGAGALRFLQHVLTNNAEALDIRETGAQYTMIPNEAGGAVDDAYLYRFVEEEYLLVVNGSNRRVSGAPVPSGDARDCRVRPAAGAHAKCREHRDDLRCQG
jgi:aminomethyltransferase